jgi:hypothetical protein
VRLKPLGTNQFLMCLWTTRDMLLISAQPAAVVSDGDVVRPSRGSVLGRNIQDAVGVDVKGDINAGHAQWSRRDAGEVERAKQVVVLGACALSLKHPEGHGDLIVTTGGEVP